jgi:hypothetical protein
MSNKRLLFEIFQKNHLMIINRLLFVTLEENNLTSNNILIFEIIQRNIHNKQQQKNLFNKQ